MHQRLQHRQAPTYHALSAAGVAPEFYIMQNFTHSMVYPCPAGTYQVAFNASTACDSCPTGITTSGSASTSPLACQGVSFDPTAHCTVTQQSHQLPGGGACYCVALLACQTCCATSRMRAAHSVHCSAAAVSKTAILARPHDHHCCAPHRLLVSHTRRTPVSNRYYRPGLHCCCCS